MAGIEHKVILQRPLATIVDIGANRGQFALAAREISGARVISFEPIPSVAAIFKKIFSTDEFTKLHVAAIGEKFEKKLIHLSARDDSSSLLEITSNQSKLFPGTHEIGTLEIVVGPLDMYITNDEIIKPAMLKIDVQGYELQALAGCKTLISNFEFIYCECSFIELYANQACADKVISYLDRLGFRLTGVFNTSYDLSGGCIQSDFLFQRQV
jgi:FkbM family methyltransferase